MTSGSVFALVEQEHHHTLEERFQECTWHMQKRQVAKSFARFPINKSQHFQCLLFLAMTFCSRKYMKRWVASVNPCVRTCLGDSSNFSNFSSVSLGSLAVCLVFSKCKVQPRQQAWESIGGSCGWWMVECCSTRCGVETSSEIFQLAWQRRSLKGSGAQVGICLFYSFFLFWCVGKLNPPFLRLVSRWRQCWKGLHAADGKKVFETPWVRALPARIMREAAEARLHWKSTWAKVQRWSFDKRLSESSQKDHFFKLILVRLHFAGMTGLLLLRQFSKALLFLFVFFKNFSEIS